MELEKCIELDYTVKLFIQNAGEIPMIKCRNCDYENPDDSRFCNQCGTQFETPGDISEIPTMTRQTPIEDLNPGSTFAGRYQIIEELGIGGMGTVYKAVDMTINEKVALKLINPEIATNRKTIERFQNELRFARQVSHKNVCRMYHLSKEKDSHYIVMEYIRGENLKSMIRMTKQLSIRTAVNVAKQVCEGLAEAHRMGVVHRDLKPSNIMIDRAGNVRIMDFGIARSITAQGITGPGVMVGTPEYMSPEQVDGKKADERSDIYSLGIILYEMVTGRVPFGGDTPLSIALKHKNEIPRNPKKVNAQITEALSQMIMKCLEKKREKRYQNAAELLQDLNEIEKRLPTTESTIPRRKPVTTREITVKFSLKKLLVPVCVVAAIIILSVFGWRYFFGETGTVPLEEMVKVAVIHFQNQTGNVNYNYLQEAIPNLLITSLEQNRYIRVITWERLRDLLRQTGRDNVEVIDRDLGFELCRQEGVDAIVLGSFIKAEETFATDVKVLNVETKNLIKSTSSRGIGVDSILNKQIDELSREISRGIGLSEKKAKPTKVQIADVTTKNMEAYNYFLRGREDLEKFYYADARRSLERAVELDPEFALAHLYLARVYSFLGNSVKTKEEIEKFQKLGRKKVKGLDGLYTEAFMATFENKEKGQEKYFKLLKEIAKKYPDEKRVHFDLAKYYQGQGMTQEAIKEFNTALKLDPKFGYAINQLAYLYSSRNEFEKALEYFKKYAEVSPGNANPFDSMGEMYFRMGKLDQAVEKFRDALEIKPDFSSGWKISYIYALQEDYDEAFKWVDQYIDQAPSLPLKSVGYQLKAFYYHILGNLEQAFKAIDKAEELAWKEKDMNLVDVAYRMKLWICYEWGKIGLYRDYAKKRMEFRTNNDLGDENYNNILFNFYEGVIDVKSGQIEKAKSKLAAIQALIRELEPKLAKEVKMTTLDYLHILILIEEGSVDEATELIQKMPPSQVSFNIVVTFIRRNLPFDDDLMARALLKKGEMDKAIADYERITTLNLNIGLDRPLIHPLSRYRLAKLYEMTGQTDKAAEQYRKALDIWQNTDDGLSPVEDARQRLSVLENKTSSH